MEDSMKGEKNHKLNGKLDEKASNDDRNILMEISEEKNEGKSIDLQGRKMKPDEGEKKIDDSEEGMERKKSQQTELAQKEERNETGSNDVQPNGNTIKNREKEKGRERKINSKLSGNISEITKEVTGVPKKVYRKDIDKIKRQEKMKEQERGAIEPEEERGIEAKRTKEVNIESEKENQMTELEKIKTEFKLQEERMETLKKLLAKKNIVNERKKRKLENKEEHVAKKSKILMKRNDS